MQHKDVTTYGLGCGRPVFALSLNRLQVYRFCTEGTKQARSLCSSGVVKYDKKCQAMARGPVP